MVHVDEVGAGSAGLRPAAHLLLRCLNINACLLLNVGAHLVLAQSLLNKSGCLIGNLLRKPVCLSV